jgi:carboxypeptidase Q
MLRLLLRLAVSCLIAGGARAAEQSGDAGVDRAAVERILAAALASDHGERRLSELCDGIGHRLSGSKSLERAVQWAAQAMRENGLENVRLQPVLVPHWERGEESAVMLEPGPQPLSILGLGRSVGTPRGGITAEVVAVNSWSALNALPDDAVRGKIVLYNVPFTNYGRTVRYRGAGANRAAARGAVAALVRSVGPTSLRTPHTGNMSAYTDSFPRIPAAAVTIEDAEMMQRLLDRGRRVRVRLQMQARMHKDALSHNVIGELRGHERPQEIVVLGGHIDSWDTGQGAHDDGGGCVASMEALRLIQSLGLRPRRTLRVVLWTNEENGLKGAEAYRDSVRADIANHVAALESDGGMERPKGFGIKCLLAGSDSTDTARQARARRRMEMLAPLLAEVGATVVDDNGGAADTGPLMRLGVPGLSHHTIGEKYFEWHHTPADMLDKIDPVEFRKNVAAIAALVYAIADLPERIDAE